MSRSDLDESRSDLGRSLSVRIAIIASVFSAVVCLFLLIDYSRRLAKDPLESPQFKALKAELAKRPRDEGLKKEIQSLDLELRQSYFRQRRFAAAGAWLLLGGVAVAVVAMKSALTRRRRLPMPEVQLAPIDTDSQVARIARWSVAALALVLAGSAMALSMNFRSELPERAELLVAKVSQPSHPAKTKQGAEKPGPTATGQSAAEPRPQGKPRGNWPRFRGPSGLGVSTSKDVPTEWDATSGKGIAWKTAVPLPGNNSPVVWESRVFLTGATEDRREVLCFDADTGKLLWQQAVSGTPESTAEPPEVLEQTGLAAPTAATDGERVFAIFANGDLAALDFSGKVVWARSLGIPKNSYGHASSLMVHAKLLLIQFDQGSIKEKLSKLLALDVATGKTVWEVPREVANSWPTPIVAGVGDQEQLITCADPWVIAYDPATGSEIWRAKCLRGDVGPSPAYAGGVAYVANEFPCLSAIKADGKGDVTESHVLWTGEDSLPDTCSPLATEEFVFTMASYGLLTCYDAKSGEMLWEEEFNDANFNSSPSLVGNHIYLFSEEGKCWVVEPGREGCKRIAENELGEKCVTSPAFQDGRFFIRGETQLFCVGGKE